MSRPPTPRSAVAPALAFLIAGATGASAQDRLGSMPGADQFRKMQPLYQSSFKSGSVLNAAPRGPNDFDLQ